jgi:hypothetical protein
MGMTSTMIVSVSTGDFQYPILFSGFRIDPGNKQLITYRHHNSTCIQTDCQVPGNDQKDEEQPDRDVIYLTGIFNIFHKKGYLL